MFEPVVLSTLSSGQISIENQFIIVVINTHGQLTRLFDKKAQREVIALGSTANVFKIYEDVPLYWDAWDVEIYHLEKGWNAQLGLIKIKEQNSLRVIIECNSKITSTSSISQQIIITATSPLIEFETNVSWNENRKILKVEFPVDISCDYATYESQFGYVQRPTHSNTSWDMSKFEVCGHKFVDFSEFGYGVSLLNDCKYGMAVHGNLIRLSLLRAPKAPDEHCDLGDHTFRYALYPHSGTFHESNVVQTAYQFNVAPLILYIKII